MSRRWSMLDSSTRSHIERQLEHLTRLSTEFRELLRDLPYDDPGLERRAALSSLLQSFYQGIEGIFERIAKRIDGSMPSSSDWHRQLLNQMGGATDRRPPVISAELAERLDPYLGFRHLARHTYPFLLNWRRMRGLVEELDAVLLCCLDEIKGFMDKMGSPDDEFPDQP